MGISNRVPVDIGNNCYSRYCKCQGRSIGINGRQSQTPIESFIQTDAAVNQGNSGGALITTDGQLIGINSAIYAPTGTYAGYSFAIPVNLAKKIVNDLIKFGDVKGHIWVLLQTKQKLTQLMVPISVRWLKMALQLLQV